MLRVCHGGHEVTDSVTSVTSMISVAVGTPGPEQLRQPLGQAHWPLLPFHLPCLLERQCWLDFRVLVNFNRHILSKSTSQVVVEKMRCRNPSPKLMGQI